MNNAVKGDVWVGRDGWRVVITSFTNKKRKKYVTFFAGYDTITEEIEVFINGYTKESEMKSLNNECDLGNAYSDWLSYKASGEGREHIRFGQYVYNEYDLEYKNSYNVRSELDAYNLLSEYVYLKGLDNESK